MNLSQYTLWLLLATTTAPKLVQPFVPTTFRTVSSSAVTVASSVVTRRGDILVQQGFESRQLVLCAKSENKDDDDDDDDDYLEEEDDEEIDVSNLDWRAFRAKLVMQKTRSTELPSKLEVEGDLDGIGQLFESTEQEIASQKKSFSMTPLHPSQWAYDSGTTIEKGTVILGGVEQEYGFGLRQQYFHKAAILVLEHDEMRFTKAIILNRPTDHVLDDDVNPGLVWRVWFGGDVQGLSSTKPDIVCLHSLRNEQAQRASMPVMNDIQWTTFDNAKQLVKARVASPTDFWVFSGYAGWGPGQLMGELERKSWYMVATDSQTLLQELARQSVNVEPRDAGLDTWNQLMGMIGRKETAERASGTFDDLMLKEWALENLLSKHAGGGGRLFRSPLDDKEDDDLNRPKPIDELLERVVSTTSPNSKVAVGSVVRSKNDQRSSPFLLENQELHKAVLVIISVDETFVVGAMLNRPSGKGIDIQIKDRVTGRTEVETIPVRFGGQYMVQGSQSLLWLHNNESLKMAGIGYEIGTNRSGIWRCTADDVSTAIGANLARAEDFMVISGVAVWTKDGRMPEGVMTPIISSNFEYVHETQIKDIWGSLMVQEVLDKKNLKSSVLLANDAWKRCESRQYTIRKAKDENSSTPVGGLGENCDEDKEDVVYKSDKKVSELADDALSKWLSTFLLGWGDNGSS